MRVAAGLILAASWAGVAASETDREALATRIEALSYTTNAADPMGQPVNRQAMQVEGCDILMRQVHLPDGGAAPVLLIEGRFDLGRTALADPSVRAVPTIGVGRMGPLISAEIGGFLLLEFVAPYRPVITTRATIVSDLRPAAYPTFPYVMSPLSDPRQIHDLNAALWAYQARYCTFTG